MPTGLCADGGFADAGFVVRRAAVPLELTDAVARRLNREISQRGLTTDEIASGARGTFFPHLRWEPEVLAIQHSLAELVSATETEQWADPQLLLRFPDDTVHGQPWAHLDEPPPWADGRTYRIIAGVALNRSSSVDGCLAVWPRSHLTERSEPCLVELQAGDVVLLHPMLWHAPTLNVGSWIRYAVYFRLLCGREVEAAPTS
jgi:ectoine hydroxylase-related dioxygenase (phytanoyl-CoA dioxygenase family)